MATVRAATVAIRTRLIAALKHCDGEVSTPELCRIAGFNNLEHHAYVSPQLRALARVGVITRIPGEPGGALSWRLNSAAQDDAAHSSVPLVTNDGRSLLSYRGQLAEPLRIRRQRQVHRRLRRRMN